MAVCDYCGTTYRGGSIKDRDYRFCSGLCHERGMELLSYLDHLPMNKIESFIMQEHEGPCSSCGKNRNVDVYSSYQIWSALIYSKWWTNTFVACHKCPRIKQAKDLTFCLTAGWWSPHGFLITPFQAVFNIAALLRHQNPKVPSVRFRKLMKLNLARYLAAK
jgi:hypothetical protein